jgi:hypothetical protein
MNGNNPGNLRKWGTYPVANGFAVFPSLQTGTDAMRDQLKLYFKRGLNTIQKIVFTWAPPSENNSVAYIQAVCKLSGYQEHQVLDHTDPTEMGRLMYGMIHQEQGGMPVPLDLLQKAVGAAPGTPLSGPFPHKPAMDTRPPAATEPAAKPTPLTADELNEAEIQSREV